MRVRNINVTIKRLGTALHEFAETFEKASRGRPNVREELSFENIRALRTFLTDRRLELLHVIKRHRPDSIYGLAKIVKRDLKSVNTDLRVLVDLGLVSLYSVRQERARMKPRVDFDRLHVEITI